MSVQDPVKAVTNVWPAIWRATPRYPVAQPVRRPTALDTRTVRIPRTRNTPKRERR